MTRAQWAQSGGAGAGMAFSPFGSGQSGGGGSTRSQTVGMGLYGNNYDTNEADPYGTGVAGRGGASSLWSGGTTTTRWPKKPTTTTMGGGGAGTFTNIASMLG